MDRKKRKKKQTSGEKRQMIWGILCLSFLCSTACGAVAANLSAQEAASQVQSLIAAWQTDGMIVTYGGKFFKYLKYLLLIWLGGQVTPGLFLSVGTLLFRGACLGYASSAILLAFGKKGLLFAASAIVPQNLFLVPAYLAMTWAALRYATRRRQELSGKDALLREKRKDQTEYVLLLLGGVILLALGAFTEVLLMGQWVERFIEIF